MGGGGGELKLKGGQNVGRDFGISGVVLPGDASGKVGGCCLSSRGGRTPSERKAEKRAKARAARTSSVQGGDRKQCDHL